MSNDPPLDQANFQDHIFVSDGGERVTHLRLDHVYYAHLSIYKFARQFCNGAVVLDAGCGSGYGAAYLADSGAAFVQGIDVSVKAIAFSQYHFRRANLDFRVMDLNKPLDFPSGSFDLIYASNTLEHIVEVGGFLLETRRLLKSDGKLLIAVPPITDDQLLALNLKNQYHVNLWSPRQWEFALSRVFGRVDPFLHAIGHLGTEFESIGVEQLSQLTEDSFEFAAGSVNDMYGRTTLTSIFVAAQPRLKKDLPATETTMTMVDGSFSRPTGYIDPALRRRLRAYFAPPPRQRLKMYFHGLANLVRKALIIGRTQGLGALTRAVVTHPQHLWRAARRKRAQRASIVRDEHTA